MKGPWRARRQSHPSGDATQCDPTHIGRSDSMSPTAAQRRVEPAAPGCRIAAPRHHSRRPSLPWNEPSFDTLPRIGRRRPGQDAAPRAPPPTSSRSGSPRSTPCRATHPRKSGLVETVRMAMAVRNRLELQQERERGMLAVIESAQDLSGRLDLNDLLSAIVSRARNLLGSDVAWLSTYDAESDEFRVLVTDGAMAQGTSGMVARRDRGVVSVVMSTRLPFTTPDYLHDRRFSHSTQARRHVPRGGHRGARRRAADLGRRGRSACCSSPTDTTACTRRRPRRCCRTLATHAAVAIKNARDFEHANAALAQRRPGAGRARAAPSQHPGRDRRARADHVAARTRRIARDAVPVGGADARGQRAGARRGRARGEPRRRRRIRRCRRARLRAARRACRRAEPRHEREPIDGPLGGRLSGGGRMVPRAAGHRRRRHPRHGAAVPSRRARGGARCGRSSAAPASSASCCSRSNGSRPAQPRRRRRCCDRSCRRARTTRPCSPTVPGDSASTSRGRWRSCS